jgi:hypothetical protein
LITHVHWTDQKAHDREYAGSKTVVAGEFQRERMRDRLRRVGYANKILSFYGLSMKDWNGSKYTLSDRKGTQKVINDLGELWPEARKMAGRRIDPLDPGLLNYLSAFSVNGSGALG